MPQKTVLMMQPLQNQGQIWHTALTSQELAVIWEAEDFPLVESLTQMQQLGLDLPDLLLLDVRAQSMNPYGFCRWCRDHCPSVKVLLTNSQQSEISPSERRWAMSQGAFDLLPGFQPDILMVGVTSAINRILQILEWQPLQQEKLILALQELTAENTPSPAMLPLGRPLPAPSNPKADADSGTFIHIPDKAPPPIESRPLRKYRGAFY
ncbi:hypothetical protein [Neosynechococcus sphagnicola]|uniref:hypothetical protein n=1 Tax=Neosynechococcus sphagnicola TaxID=1501145 RepID=UPI00055FF780|nr:hypothetical protein [Neosynechococcus sphagnicola]